MYHFWSSGVISEGYFNGVIGAGMGYIFHGKINEILLKMHA